MPFTKIPKSDKEELLNDIRNIIKDSEEKLLKKYKWLIKFEKGVTIGVIYFLLEYYLQISWLIKEMIKVI